MSPKFTQVHASMLRLVPLGALILVGLNLAPALALASPQSYSQGSTVPSRDGRPNVWGRSQLSIKGRPEDWGSPLAPSGKPDDWGSASSTRNGDRALVHSGFLYSPPGTATVGTLARTILTTTALMLIDSPFGIRFLFLFEKDTQR